MSRCNFCDGQCACHINPPCGFHESHYECEICGQLVCEDKKVILHSNSDNDEIIVCPTCAKDMEDEGDK